MTEKSQCETRVVWGTDGILSEPRRCERSAREGDIYCGPHIYQRRNGRLIFEVAPSGFCLHCAGAARTYSLPSGLRIALCDDAARALVLAIQGAVKRKTPR